MKRRCDRETFSFRPGQPLGAYMVHFDHPPGAGYEDKFEIVNQSYRLRQSVCFQKSAGRLTCTTCHNPHERVVVDYRAKCVDCHPSVVAKNHPGIRTADCALRQMPRRGTKDAVHVVMTDHRIQRRPPPGDLTKPMAERTERYRGPLVVYYPEAMPESEQDLYLGVALITGSADRRHGIALLERAVEAGAPAKAIAVLGEGYFAEGSIDRAIEMFRRAAGQDPSPAKARYNLGQALQETGAAEAAITEYRKAIEIRPDLVEAHLSLGQALGDAGRLDAAIAEFRQVLRLRPGHAEAQKNLDLALTMKSRGGR